MSETESYETASQDLRSDFVPFFYFLRFHCHYYSPEIIFFYILYRFQVICISAHISPVIHMPKNSSSVISSENKISRLTRFHQIQMMVRAPGTATIFACHLHHILWYQHPGWPEIQRSVNSVKLAKHAKPVWPGFDRCMDISG